MFVRQFTTPLSPSIVKGISVAMLFGSLSLFTLSASAAGTESESETLQQVAKDVEASEALAPKDIEIKENIEIIGVFAQTPLLYFKREMERAELDFYESFNAIADEDRFRIKCRMESKIGSRIKKRAC